MELKKKLAVYQKKLLDTGRKNKLINYRFSLSSNVELLNDDFDEISAKIIDNTSFKFANLFEKLDEFNENQEKMVSACGKKIEKKDIYDFAEIRVIKERFSPLKSVNYLYSNTLTSVLRKTLRNLKNKAIVFYEENGINVLYLALGFLNYTDIEGFTNKAPLCLVPVSLEAKTITADYVLKALDDNFVYNETLSYKLKLENKIELIKPLENEGINEYLSRVEEFAKENKFTVSKDISLGLFSFSKIKMYQDLTDYLDVYLENPVLNALCGDTSKLLINNDDRVSSYSEDLEVLNADASQMEAIKNAKLGKSFVLQGPPGCGKSQTITNIIGELIAQNKSVLFICEKKAALDVVYKNLSKRGLGAFCLPLHDPKSNKKDIIDGIYNNLVAIQSQRQTLSKKALDVYDSYHALEGKLDSYVEALNYKPFNNEIDVKALLELYYQNISASEVDIDLLGYEDILKDEKLMDSFILKYQKLGSNKYSNPYYGFKLLSLDLAAKDEMLIVLKELAKLLENILRNQTFSQLKYISIETIDNFFRALPIYELLLQAPSKINIEYFDYDDIATVKELALRLKDMWASYIEMENTILNKYEADVFELPISKLLDEAKQHSSIMRIFSKKYKDIKNLLEVNLNSYTKLKYKDILTDLKIIKAAIDIKKNITLEDSICRIKYADFYFGKDTNFDNFISVLDYLLAFQQKQEEIHAQAIDYADLLIAVSSHNLSLINAEYILILPFKEWLDGLYKKYLLYFDSKNERIDELMLKLKERISIVSSVYDYVDYNKAYYELEEKHVGVAVALENYGKSSVLKTFAKQSLIEVNRKFGLNSDFARSMNEYGICLQQMYDFSSIKIGELVSDSWPQMDSLASANTEVMTLRSEANKKRKLKPLKDTFSAMPKLLKDLKPCFMMSPLSVATFLNPLVFHFDVVIFDEASQLTSENAIGAIARGNSVIVCGDNEQLPPTSFFAQEATDEDDYEYDVYESILDECKAVLPTIMLKWHYRSRNEALIEFSNNEIYHDLLTFKEPYLNKDGQGVQYIYVEDGQFERGKNRVNLKEAEKVVKLVFDHFKRYPDKSLGVVTFNTTQQALIEKMIAKERYLNKEYEAYFSDTLKDSFFIKNLETVQGDERDRIIISIGYAKDESGKLSMNFGPLNQTGGYKRLNVAITRAKENVTLVGSLLPSDFDLSKTDSRGVKMLKGYIEFAMNNVNKKTKSNLEESYIAKDIIERLDKLGYKCNLKVGNSPIKIDIAVLDKNNIDYRLAIIIDSESYANNKASKDRNYLFNSVLKNRGWLVYNLFSFRYLENPERVLDEILLLLTDGNKNEEVAGYNQEAFQEAKEIASVKAYDLFDVYPNVNGLAQVIAKENIPTTDKLYKLIEKCAPIYIDDLLRLAIIFYDKQKLTQIVRDTIEADIALLVAQNKVVKSVNFILLKGQIFNVKFRRHDELNEETREIEHIYIDEIAAGIIKIIEVTQEMDKMSLYSVLSELLGYSKITQKVIDVYQRALANCEYALDILDGKIIYK